MKNELTYEEKKKLILGLIYQHFNMELSDVSSDSEIVEIIMKVCEVKND